MKIRFNQKWYKPREIARLGLIKNSTGGDNENSNYYFILMLIKTGRLKAKNYSRGEGAYWQVSEREIESYHKTEG